MRAPDNSKLDRGGYPCQVHYYSPQERLFVEYRFPRRHLDKWREIDDAVWARLHSWEVE